MFARALTAGALAAIATATAHAAVTSFTTPAALEAFVGSPMIAVPDDGAPIGALYGPATPLITPFGPMSFDPVHEKVAPGTYHPFTFAPLAGSDIVVPTGAIAFDFTFIPLVAMSVAIEGVGTTSSSGPIVTPILTPGTPFYAGFVATGGETLDLITIITVPFGTTPPETWHITDMRVLPAPASAAALAAATLLRRRRRN